MSHHYILDGHTPVSCDDLTTWATWMMVNRGQVAFTKLGIAGRGGVLIEVSTIFLGFDHNWGMHGWPKVFETMIFANWEATHLSGFPLMTNRAATWDEAVKDHHEAVEWAQDFLAQIPDDEL